MKELEQLESLSAALGGAGVFVTAGNPPNTMTASWGGIGVMWKKPILAVPIRASRYTFQKIRHNDCFSVSVPAPGTMREELSFFGSRSGRDLDKYRAQNCSPIPCRDINTFVIPDCARYFECRVLYVAEIKPERLPEGFISAFYADHDYHTVFYGEIVSSYTQTK